MRRASSPTLRRGRTGRQAWSPNTAETAAARAATCGQRGAPGTPQKRVMAPIMKTGAQRVDRAVRP
eukprot:9585214-Lingulodinium_polyedra.AAC.1